MAIETEKKYRLDARQKQFVLDALARIGARYAGEDFEENTVYGGGVLDEKRAILRVRRTQDRTLLTFKRRANDEFAVKQQIEYETEVADHAELARIIENLDFTARLIYEKRRRTWRFRQTEIALDELPFGEFLEIEGSITAIAEAEMFLSIEDFPTEHETYPFLTAKFGVRKGDLIEARLA